MTTPSVPTNPQDPPPPIPLRVTAVHPPSPETVGEAEVRGALPPFVLALTRPLTYYEAGSLRMVHGGSLFEPGEGPVLLWHVGPDQLMADAPRLNRMMQIFADNGEGTRLTALQTLQLWTTRASQATQILGPS